MVGMERCNYSLLIKFSPLFNVESSKTAMDLAATRNGGLCSHFDAYGNIIDLPKCTCLYILHVLENILFLVEVLYDKVEIVLHFTSS